MRRNKKGFTLTELTVCMTISLLVMGIVTALVVIAKNDMQITTVSANRINEFYKIEKFINNWFYSFVNEDYELVASSKEKAVIEEEDEEGNVISSTEIDYLFSTYFTEFRLDKDEGPDITYSLGFDVLLNQFVAEYPGGTETYEATMINNARFTTHTVTNPVSGEITGYMVKVTLFYEESTYTMLFNYYL